MFFSIRVGIRSRVSIWEVAKMRVLGKLILLCLIVAITCNIVCVEDESGQLQYCYYCTHFERVVGYCRSYKPKYCNHVKSLPCEMTSSYGSSCSMTKCKVLSGVKNYAGKSYVEVRKNFIASSVVARSESSVDTSTMSVPITAVTEAVYRSDKNKMISKLNKMIAELVTKGVITAKSTEQHSTTTKAPVLENEENEFETASNRSIEIRKQKKSTVTAIIHVQANSIVLTSKQTSVPSTSHFRIRVKPSQIMGHTKTTQTFFTKKPSRKPTTNQRARKFTYLRERPKRTTTMRLNMTNWETFVRSMAIKFKGRTRVRENITSDSAHTDLIKTSKRFMHSTKKESDWPTSPDSSSVYSQKTQETMVMTVPTGPPRPKRFSNLPDTFLKRFVNFFAMPNRKPVRKQGLATERTRSLWDGRPCTKSPMHTSTPAAITSQKSRKPEISQPTTTERSFWDGRPVRKKNKDLTHSVVKGRSLAHLFNLIPMMREFQEVVHCPSKPLDCQSTIQFEHDCFVLIQRPKYCMCEGISTCQFYHMKNIPCPHWTCWDRVVPIPNSTVQNTTTSPEISTLSPAMESNENMILEIALPLLGCLLVALAIMMFVAFKRRARYVAIEDSSNQVEDGTETVELEDLGQSSNTQPSEAASQSAGQSSAQAATQSGTPQSSAPKPARRKYSAPNDLFSLSTGSSSDDEVLRKKREREQSYMDAHKRIDDYMNKKTKHNPDVSDLSTSEDEPESWEGERRKFEFQKKKIRHNYKKKVLAERKPETVL